MRDPLDRKLRIPAHVLAQDVEDEAALLDLDQEQYFGLGVAMLVLGPRWLPVDVCAGTMEIIGGSYRDDS